MIGKSTSGNFKASVSREKIQRAAPTATHARAGSTLGRELVALFSVYEGRCAGARFPLDSIIGKLCFCQGRPPLKTRRLLFAPSGQ
eukprot:185074-Pyramimonas_sp.AAC.1